MKEDRSASFDLSTVLTDQEIEILATRRVTLSRSTQYEVSIVTLTSGMKLSPAAQLAVWLMRREAAGLIAKKRDDDAMAFLNVDCLELMSTIPELAVRATETIARICGTFTGANAKAEVLQLLNTWQSETSKRSGDKQKVLDAYQRAVGIVATFYGPAIINKEKAA
jgi:hypothetical protein